MENVFTIYGGTRSFGVYEGHNYDKIKLTALVNASDGSTFGAGKPVILSFNTPSVLKALGLTSYSDLTLLKFPFKVKVTYAFNSSGSPYADGVVKIN